MEKASEKARTGDLDYFTNMPEDELCSLVSRKDSDGRSLLHTACASGNLELVKLVASKGGLALINEQDDEGWAPLHSAVSCGHEAITDFLIHHDATVDVTNSGRRTPLHYAASKSGPALVRKLLQAGAKVNAQDATGSTALHRAASSGRADSVVALVEQGRAKLDVRDRQGATPLFVAVDCDQSNIALYLAAKGADLEVEVTEGVTPLTAANPTLRSALVSAAKSGRAGGDDEEGEGES